MPPVWNGVDLEDVYTGKIPVPNYVAAHYLANFFLGPLGEKYGLGPNDKIDFFNKFCAHMQDVESHTGNLKHIFMAEMILSIDPKMRGDIVECGAFKGSSAISLSHVAARIGRRLIVCDSFQGLPEGCDSEMVLPHHQHSVPIAPGDFKGTRAEVEANIRRFGVIEQVDFIEGFFDASLHALRNPIVFAHIDVDLASSTRDCLLKVWPLMPSGGIIVTDDAPDIAVAKVYFDDVWWQDNLGCPAPGLIGAGCGVRPSFNNATGQGYLRKP